MLQQRMGWWVALVAVGVLLGSSVGLRSAAYAEGPEAYELRYQGEFIDTDRKPLSGVFPLSFKIYESAEGRKALWQESHFIAVAQGQYAVILGQQAALPPAMTEKTLYLGVELDGKEMFRQRLSPKPVALAVSSGGGMSAVAGYCEQCDISADAERLGGKLPEDYAPAALAGKLDKHIADPNAHSTAGGAAKKGGGLSKQTWTSAPAGGAGGTPYTLSCPDGYVVTGVRGRAAALIDSVEVVCTKLE